MPRGRRYGGRCRQSGRGATRPAGSESPRAPAPCPPSPPPLQTQRLDHPVRLLPGIPRRIVEALGKLLRIVEAVLHVVGVAHFLATGLAKQRGSQRRVGKERRS